MSAQTWELLAWAVPVGMVAIAVALLTWALVIDGARRERWQTELYRAELARRAMARALQGPRPEHQRRIDKWGI